MKRGKKMKSAEKGEENDKVKAWQRKRDAQSENGKVHIITHLHPGRDGMARVHLHAGIADTFRRTGNRRDVDSRGAVVRDGLFKLQRRR